jgi:DNA-binding MarR family transcriptional regulator
MLTETRDPKAGIAQISGVFSVENDPTGASGPGGDNLISEMGRMMHTFHRAFYSLTGMSGAQWRMISLLAREETMTEQAIQERIKQETNKFVAGVSQRKIQALLGVDAAGITRVAKQLEQEGMIRRETAPQDNRFTLIYLTDAGRQLYEDVQHKVLELWQQAFVGISHDEVLQLRGNLRRLADNLSEIVEADTD